jgi:uncharacterized protein with HEPN domain
MSERRDRDWLNDMLAEAELLASAISGKTLADFQSDPVLQRAVQHMLQTIGEASTKLDAATLNTIEGVPWQQVKGMRNRIVHGYFGLDSEAVWLTATGEVPKLAKAVRAFLAQRRL